MFCQKQAVRGSWETAKSDWRRISPARGERTSPGWLLLLGPGKSLPFKSTSRKTWLSNVPTVESKGVPGMFCIIYVRKRVYSIGINQLTVSTTSAAAMV